MKLFIKMKKISSSRIRNHLERGQIEDLNELLGRQYTIKGEVIKGRRIGHSIGFPTANIDYHSYFLPVNGVYGVKVYIQGQCYIGMCNIGYNPILYSVD